MTAGYLYMPLLYATAHNSRKADPAITGKVQLFVQSGHISSSALAVHSFCIYFLLLPSLFLSFFSGDSL